jgi:hypothetical protein
MFVMHPRLLYIRINLYIRTNLSPPPLTPVLARAHVCVFVCVCVCVCVSSSSMHTYVGRCIQTTAHTNNNTHTPPLSSFSALSLSQAKQWGV